MDRDGGAYWNKTLGTCVEACEETFDIRRVCRKCHEIDSKMPAAFNGECVQCWKADDTRPIWNSDTQRCEACPYYVPIWRMDKKMCTAPCPAGSMLVEGVCG